MALPLLPFFISESRMAKLLIGLVLFWTWPWAIGYRPYKPEIRDYEKDSKSPKHSEA
jgi:hypothetical protein